MKNFGKVYKGVCGGILAGAMLANIAGAQESGAYISGALGMMINNSENNIKYTAIDNANNTTIDRSDASSTANLNLSYGVRAGYLLALSPRNAFRAYASFSAGNYTIGTGDMYMGDKQDHYLMRAGAGLDYVLSFSTKPNSWGLIAGGGYEYGFGNLASELKGREGEYSMHIPYANAALFKAFGSGHASLEIGVKVPFVTHYKYELKNGIGQVPNESGATLTATGIYQTITSGTTLTPYAALSIKF
ncbi:MULTISPECIES: hypothetical protein, partial [unclassified Helicobacter]|uniref:hypothetical protein n=1 Tax=unclassified Helicobacter TaxID=2593540 RepID=UPI0018F85EB7